VRLVPHFTHINYPNIKIEANISLKDSILLIKYIMIGDILSLNIPKYKTPKFVYGLWNATCFELFIANKNQDSYIEFNFSPSKEWACYAFNDYRLKDKNIDVINPSIDFLYDEYSAEMIVSFDISYFNYINFDDLDVSITAVIKNDEDEVSYWAINHAKENADFHARESFLELKNLKVK